MLRRRAKRGKTLDERLAALAEAVAAGRGVVDEATLAGAEALVRRAGERLGHGVDRTVVALGGATGSGKSSLFNAIAGADLSTVGVRRPTTSVTSACVWDRGEHDEGAADGLLDWLEIPRRHRLTDGDPALEGLVLLDLPDHDSIEAAHRREVDRVVAVADAVVWVLDPQKYADRAIHEDYLRPLAGHAGVLVVDLHQADRLTPAALQQCLADLRRLLAADGLDGVPLIATSVRPGAEPGIAPLQRALAELVAAHGAATDRLEADCIAIAHALRRHCAGGIDDKRAGTGGDADLVGDRERNRVTAALAEAAGVGIVAEASADSYRGRAVAATGWPVTRWVRRLRPDPLRRLHLGKGDGTGAARTSLPTASAVSQARVETALGRLADAAGSSLPLAWADALRDEVATRAARLGDQLDHAIASTDLGAARAPAWWRVVGFLQGVLLAVAVAGAVWLAVLAGLAYLQLDVADIADGPEVAGRLPLPTALLLGGVAVGILVAALARPFAALGAKRRARRARERLQASVREVADAEVLAPVDAVLARSGAFCDAVARAG